MSLIHDSLRKLETKQVKNIGSGFAVADDSYLKNRNSVIKKLWIGLVVAIGIGLIYYAYTILSNYQKQNEILLNDIKNIKLKNAGGSQNINQAIALKQDKVTVQTPVAIKRDPHAVLVATQERQKEVSELNHKLIMNNSQVEKPQSVAQIIAQINKPLKHDITPKFNSKLANKAVAVSKPILSKKVTAKRTVPKKLSVKQTRQLVNNLQMQIELKNKQEVRVLLKKLAQSSGKESLVYLRMNAYWSNINGDKGTATVMYKKILFQKPYDIQAGTNLALIEASSNQKQQAMKRLELLKTKYPSDKTILNYFNKIETN